MTPNADRAAVAREVLTEEHATALRQVLRSIEEEAKATGRWAYYTTGWAGNRLNELLTAIDPSTSSAPETVTVGAVNTLRTGTANTLAVTVDRRVWTLEVDGRWRWGSLVVERSNWAHDMLDRIASDARVIAELKKRVEEQPRTLYAHLWQAIDDMGNSVGAVTGIGSNCFETARRVCETIATLKTERDAAVRALEEKGDWHGAKEHVSGNAGDAGSSPAAPIPLGAVVEVEGDEDSPYERVTNGWRFARTGGVAYDWDTDTSAPCVTALYRARHPVASREMVERVAEAMWNVAPILSGWKHAAPCHVATQMKLARAALSAAGFTLEGA